MRSQSKTTSVLSSSGILIFPGDQRATPLQIGTDRWLAWLKEAQTFYYQGDSVGFTVRPEKRRQQYFWYAFKKITNKTHKQYVGNAESLTLEQLQTIEVTWQERLKMLIQEKQVTQRDFPQEILYGLFEDEQPMAYLAWEHPEIRYQARAGLYFIRHGDWLYEIQADGHNWQIFAFSNNQIYTEDIRFDTLKSATYVASKMKPR